jgi:hypothetical protein
LSPGVWGSLGNIARPCLKKKKGQVVGGEKERVIGGESDQNHHNKTH